MEIIACLSSAWPSGVLNAEILNWITRQAASQPDAPAMMAPGREPLTFQRLQHFTLELAHNLKRWTADTPAIVAVVLPTGPETATAMLGIAACGTAAPLNPDLTQAEYEFFLEDLRADGVIVKAGAPHPAIEAARTLGLCLLEAEWSFRDFAGVFSLHPITEKVLKPSIQEEIPRAALLLHTSATTGHPKLVPLTAGALAANCVNIQKALQLVSSDRLLSMMPLFHLQGLISCVVQMSVGGCAIITPGFDAGELPSWLERHQPTWFTGGPTLHHAFVDAVDRTHRAKFTSLRFVRSIGAKLDQALLLRVEEVLSVPLIEGYGLTEAGLVTCNPLPPGIRKLGSAGVSAGPEVGIMNADGCLLPPETEGEVVVRGPSVMTGYLHDPEANRDAFYGDWFRTGDLGRIDQDGYLFVTGRIKEMINRGGEKVLPGEVETVLLSHPAISEAVSFAVPHPRLGEDVGAAVVTRPGLQVTESALREYLRTRLAQHKIPSRIHFVDQIPKGVTGKPQRSVLAAWILKQVAAIRTSAASSDKTAAIEERLIPIWQRLLGTEMVDRDDSFFQLGGDSIGLTALLAEIIQEFGMHPSPAEFLQEPTLAHLACLVSKGQLPDSPDSGVVWLRDKGIRPPLFLIPAESDPFTFRNLAYRLSGQQPVCVLNPWHHQKPGFWSVETMAQQAVELIRGQRPHSPLFIGGHCFGGIVAFETARQLAARGHEVLLLVLFDTPTPGYPKVSQNWQRYGRAAIRSLPAVLQGQARPVLSKSLAYLKILTGRAQRRLTGRLRAIVRKPDRAEIAESPVDGTPPQAEKSLRIQEYFPSSIKVPIVHLMAAESPANQEILEDSRFGWRDFALAGYQARKISGGHNALFVEPFVTELAAELESYLAGVAAPGNSHRNGN